MPMSGQGSESTYVADGQILEGECTQIGCGVHHGYWKRRGHEGARLGRSRGWLRKLCWCWNATMKVKHKKGRRTESRRPSLLQSFIQVLATTAATLAIHFVPPVVRASPVMIGEAVCAIAGTVAVPAVAAPASCFLDEEVRLRRTLIDCWCSLGGSGSTH